MQFPHDGARPNLKELDRGGLCAGCGETCTVAGSSFVNIRSRHHNLHPVQYTVYLRWGKEGQGKGYVSSFRVVEYQGPDGKYCTLVEPLAITGRGGYASFFILPRPPALGRRQGYGISREIWCLLCAGA